MRELLDHYFNDNNLNPPFLYLGERIVISMTTITLLGECLLEIYPFILSIRTAQNFP